MENRKRLMAKIHIAKGQLKMDDDVYRSFLMNVVNKDSCSAMTSVELIKVLKAFEEKGFMPVATKFKKQKRPTPAEHKAIYFKKITALLAEQQKPQSYADGIAKRSFGVDFVHWLDVWQLKKVIQMLAVFDKRKKRQKIVSE